MSGKIEDFLFEYLSTKPSLAPLIGAGANARIHPTWSPRTITKYPRLTYDIVSDLPVSTLKGYANPRDRVATVLIDVWGKGDTAYDSAVATGRAVEGDGEGLNFYRGTLEGLFIQACVMIDQTKDATKPPFDSSDEPFYNVGLTFDLYYTIL